PAETKPTTMTRETIRPGSLRQRPSPARRGPTAARAEVATALNAGNPVGQLSPLRSSNGPAYPCTALYRRDHSTRQRTAASASANLSSIAWQGLLYDASGV